MKASEVSVGMRCLTKVNGRLVVVQVIAAAPPRVTRRGRSCPRWYVARVIVDELRRLPGERTSASLGHLPPESKHAKREVWSS